METSASTTKWSSFSQMLLRFICGWLYQFQLKDSSTEAASSDSITVVCVSDTHNKQPLLPDGDLLLHAGDLTEYGTFHELQSQLDWLKSQPHKHKVVIAGNHDYILDPSFHHPDLHVERLSRADLSWGDIIYLNNSSVKLTFSSGRSLNIYGSPWTKRKGTRAFQYEETKDIWSNTVPLDTDILISHGPPKGYLDFRPGTGGPRQGDEFLRREIWRVKPNLAVFGHIHGGYGKQILRYGGVQKIYDEVLLGEGGFAAVVGMGWLLVVERLRGLVGKGKSGDERCTTLVNCSAVAGRFKETSQDPIVVGI
jgi:Icc-related predicted phosphoesterase